MDEKAAKALKPKPVSATLYRFVPRNGRASAGDNTPDPQHSEYYTLKPGDELFQLNPAFKQRTTIDGPQIVKTLHTYPLLIRGVSLLRGGVETRPSAVDPRRGDFVRPTS